jgi:hypothetical protein
VVNEPPTLVTCMIFVRTRAARVRLRAHRRSRARSTWTRVESISNERTPKRTRVERFRGRLEGAQPYEIVVEKSRTQRQFRTICKHGTRAINAASAPARRARERSDVRGDR